MKNLPALLPDQRAMQRHVSDRMKVSLILHLIFMLGVCQAQTYTVLNKGISGNNSHDLLARLDTAVLAFQPELVILMVGTNDMVNSRKFVAMDQYRKNVTELVDRIRQARSQVVVMSLLPVDEEYLYTRHDRSLYAQSPNEKITNANTFLARMAQDKHVHFVDVHQRFKAHGEPRRTADSWLRNEANAGQKDGVHPPAAGYKALAEALAAYIRQHKLPQKNIVCFGDSITYGLYVTGAGTAHGDTYPGFLRQIIDSQ